VRNTCFIFNQVSRDTGRQQILVGIWVFENFKERSSTDDFKERRHGKLLVAHAQPKFGLAVEFQLSCMRLKLSFSFLEREKMHFWLFW
jgi:hypothetical protein